MIWYLLGLGAALFAAFSSVTEKKTLFKEHAMEFSTVFAVFMLIISLPLAFIADFNIPGAYWIILALLGIIDAIAFLLMAKAIRHMELSEASPLMTFGPAFVALFAYAFLREALTAQHFTGMALVVLGAYALEFKPTTKGKINLLQPLRAMAASKYIHYIFLSLILYTVSSVIARFLLNADNPGHIEKYAFLFILHLFIALASIIFIYVFHDGFKGIEHGMRSAGKWIFLTAIFLLGSRILLTIAFTIPSAQVALTLSLKRLSSLFSTLLGGGIFKDHHISNKLIACLIMVIGAVLIVV